MKNEAQPSPAEIYTLRSGQAAEAAEEMARAGVSDVEARAAYSRLLVEQSKSFGSYVSRKIGEKHKKAGCPPHALP